MIDSTVREALRTVIKILDSKADDISNMSIEAMIDTQDTMTCDNAASYLSDILTELSLEIGQVAYALKEVTPQITEPQPVA